MSLSDLFSRTLFCALAALPFSTQARTQAPAKSGPPLETVKTFNDFHLVGLAVSREGRIFASAPAAKTGDKVVEINAETGAMTPFPDESWTSASSIDAQRQWSVPQAMWVDKADHLWVLDSGVVTISSESHGIAPKLVEFDLADHNKMIRSYGFGGVVAPSDSLNDVRIDLVHGYAYLTNIAKKGSLVVLDLKTGESRQVLVGDRSAFASPQSHFMMPNGEPAAGPNGKPLAIQADGIALSPDAAWVYYRPLTDHNYWRVPTAALTDKNLSASELAKKVQFLGTGPMTGGLIMDEHGTLYGGDLEHASVAAMTLDPATHKLKSKLFLQDKGRLSWADGFAISNGYLYIADSHLWETSFKNHLPRSGPFTIFKVKLPNA